MAGLEEISGSTLEHPHPHPKMILTVIRTTVEIRGGKNTGRDLLADMLCLLFRWILEGVIRRKGDLDWWWD